MQTVPATAPRASLSHRGVAQRLLKPIARLLQTGEPSATVDRLFKSDHVTDLQSIIAFAFFVILLVFIIGLPLSIENQVQSQWSKIAHARTKWIYVHIAFAASSSFLTFFAPVFAVFGAVIAWAYQVGSARLGVVDLFACEISTLCRVAAIVDTVHSWVVRFGDGPAAESAGRPHAPSQPFTSQENYFPVFEGNTRDLQTLEARVVINITAFYTYMKAVRDSMRSLAAMRPEPGEFMPRSKEPAIGSWREAVCHVVYMLFLGLESARHAIQDLVEFEPEKAERSVVILISELEAYRFLREQFPDERDMHYQRITLRECEYRDIVPKLTRSIEVGRASETSSRAGALSEEPRPGLRWEPAWRLLPELQRRYQAVVNSGMGLQLTAMPIGTALPSCDQLAQTVTA